MNQPTRSDCVVLDRLRPVRPRVSLVAPVAWMPPRSGLRSEDNRKCDCQARILSQGKASKKTVVRHRTRREGKDRRVRASTVSETKLPLYQGHAEANLSAPHHIGRSRSIQSPFQNARRRIEKPGWQAGWAAAGLAGVHRAAARCHLQL